MMIVGCWLFSLGAAIDTEVESSTEAVWRCFRCKSNCLPRTSSLRQAYEQMWRHTFMVKVDYVFAHLWFIYVLTYREGSIHHFI
jgi:hypothetical protein